MDKKELIAALKEIVSADQFSPEKQRVAELRQTFDELREASEKAQLEAFLTNEGVEEDFEYRKDEEDVRFAELLEVYFEKRGKFEKKRKEEEEQNFEDKQVLLEQIKQIISDEENIGKAFQRFNAIREKWNTIGNVPQQKRKDQQAEYSRMIELFYYNINIYKELQINDLKKNLELKKELIQKIHALQEEKAINQVDFLVHKYLEEWDRLGPTFQEEWEKIREDFHEAVGKVFERIKEHRKSVRDEHKAHYEEKEKLAGEVAQLTEADFTDVKDMQQRTARVLEIQKAWKSIGFAGRKKNDAIWDTFRENCDAFFNKRGAYLEENNQELKKIRERKVQLIEKARAIHESDDHARAANTLKKLQHDWKQTGKLMPREEYKLFQEFRKYCDAFFTRQKTRAEEFKKSLKENTEKKKATLEEIKGTIESVEKEKVGELVKEWTAAWTDTGEVFDKEKGALEKEFHQLIDKAYAKAGISKDQIAKKKFEDKLEAIKAGGSAENDLKRELSFVQKKIGEAKAEVLQLENKMGFFTYSDDSNPLKRDLMKRIEKSKQEVDSWKEKKKEIDLSLKSLRQKSESEAPAGEAGQ